MSVYFFLIRLLKIPSDMRYLQRTPNSNYLMSTTVKGSDSKNENFIYIYI